MSESFQGRRCHILDQHEHEQRAFGQADPSRRLPCGRGLEMGDQQMDTVLRPVESIQLHCLTVRTNRRLETVEGHGGLAVGRA